MRAADQRPRPRQTGLFSCFERRKHRCASWFSLTDSKRVFSRSRKAYSPTIGEKGLNSKGNLGECPFSSLEAGFLPCSALWTVKDVPEGAWYGWGNLVKLRARREMYSFVRPWRGELTVTTGAGKHGGKRGNPAVTLAYCVITQNEIDELCRDLDI